MDITLIVAIVGVVGSISGILLSLRKYPHEAAGIDAETMKTYTEALKMQQERYDVLEAKFDAYRAEIESRIDTLEEENDLLKDWAERLVHQVQALGEVPVKIKPRKVKEKQNV